MTLGSTMGAKVAAADKLYMHMMGDCCVPHGPFATAVEALEMVERTPPDLALLDIRLLDGVSGLTVGKHLKRQWGIPAIFVSASLQEAYKHSQLAVAIVGKPFRPETVMMAIKRGEAVIREKRPPITPVAVEFKTGLH